MKYLKITSLFVLILFSCRKQVDNSIVDGPTDTDYPYDYVLTKEVWSGVWSNGLTIEYFYNDQNLVKEIKAVQWAAGNLADPLDTSYHTDQYFLEYTDGLATKVFHDEPGSPNYWVYEYNNKRLPVKGTFFQTWYKQIGDSASNNVEIIPDYPFYFQTYAYDEKGNLIEKTDSTDGRMNFRYTYDYTDNNNLERITTHLLWSDPKEKYMHEYLDYDDHISVDKFIPGLPIAENFNIHVKSVSSMNNPRYEQHYWNVKIDEPFETPTSLSTTLHYNEAGLLVTKTFPPQSAFISYEYRKIR